MYVLAGRLKGLSLEFPKQKQVRPTQSRVRESIFNILGSHCEDAKVLDLCCGTGSLGIEAISRGASDVTFVDTDCKFVSKNCKKITIPDIKTKIVKSSVPQFLKRNKESFDLIMIDPPWNNKSLYERSLKGIFDFDILAPGGILVIESSRQADVLASIPLENPSTYEYGDTLITVVKT